MEKVGARRAVTGSLKRHQDRGERGGGRACGQPEERVSGTVEDAGAGEVPCIRDGLLCVAARR